ncbi:hypothetical protein ACGIF2_17240 [Cellulomonas sp. P22]|uniref:hypothetical protein n=1 Tax=Cellulomonas sp. P22 TaxID=3373189 RepID=UPI00379F7340
MSTHGPERDDTYGTPDARGDDTDVLGLFGSASAGSEAPAGSDDDTAVLPGDDAPSSSAPSWSAPSSSAADTAVLPDARGSATAPPAGAAWTPDPSTPPFAEPPQRPALRVGTVVWGLIIAVVGIGVLAAASGAMFDRQLALIALLGLAGVALLVGSIVTARRAHD